MIKSETELWKPLPGVPGVEVSTLGNVRTLDKVVSTEKVTRFQKGRVLKQFNVSGGYLQVNVKVDGKWTNKLVHRLVAQTFIVNPDGLPEINHKDNNPLNNNVSNLEWVTHKENIAYREKYGTPAKDFVPKSPVYAVNLKTQETLWFESQNEAGRALGAYVPNINAVIKGRLNKTNGYLFVNADENANDVIKHKLNVINKNELKAKQGGENMAKKSVTPSIRMDEDQYLKLKALKEKYNVSWNELVKYLNRVLSEDMKTKEKK